jgi:hypothetical protein
MKKSSIVIICFAGFGLLVGVFIWSETSDWGNRGKGVLDLFMAGPEWWNQVNLGLQSLFLLSSTSAVIGGYIGYRLSRTPPK